MSALSTLAMIVYPIIARSLGLDAHAAGVFIGGTIHDVAQVVGAGYSLSHETGDVATLVKLVRVAMLLPVTLFATILARGTHAGSVGHRPPLLPGFLVAFAVLLALNSVGAIPAARQSAGNDVSRWCLVAAIAGIGMKMQLKDVAAVGLWPAVLMLGETAFLAVFVLASLHWS